MAEKGLTIKKNIGDRHGECQMLVNIVNTYNVLNMKDEARKANLECMRLAKLTGNKHIEMMALVQSVTID